MCPDSFFQTQTVETPTLYIKRIYEINEVLIFMLKKYWNVGETLTMLYYEAFEISSHTVAVATSPLPWNMKLYVRCQRWLKTHESLHRHQETSLACFT